MRNLLVILMIGLANQMGAAAAAESAPQPDAGRTKDGRAIYQQSCASCHGANAEGAPKWQERNARGELPAPPHDPDGHTWRHSDAELYEMVGEGWRDPFNKTTGLTMPAFADALSPQQIRAVIEHLKTLWTPEQRQFQAEESREPPSPSKAQ